MAMAVLNIICPPPGVVTGSLQDRFIEFLLNYSRNVIISMI